VTTELLANQTDERHRSVRAIPFSREATQWGLLGVVAVWLAMVLHEAGHVLVALLMYPEDWSGALPRIGRGVVVASGPVATFALLAFALWRASRARLATGRRPSWRFVFAASLGIAAASRIALLLVSMAAGRFRGDEATLAAGVGFPIGALVALELTLSSLGAWRLVTWIPSTSRASASVGGILALGIGWWTVFAIGPMLGLPI
jgi:hypothetical protein